MRLFITTGAIVAALAAGTAAQDNTVKSRTKIKADDAKVVTMTGCLREGIGGTYTLVGTTAAAGDELTNKTKVRTDVDNDKTTVKGKSTTKADDGAVATAGAVSTYTLIPGQVNLSSQVGHQVQISGLIVDRGEGDAEVKVKDKTTVDPDNAPDHSARTTTKLDVPRSPYGTYTVVSVKSLGTTCSQ